MVECKSQSIVCARDKRRRDTIFFLSRHAIGDDRLMFVTQAFEKRLAGMLCENRNRFTLDKQAELEGFADHAEVNMHDLHAALRHDLDQPFGLEPRHQFSDGTERQLRERYKLALRNELARPDITREQMPGEARVSFFTQLERRALFRLLQGRGERHHAAFAVRMLS